MKALIIAAGKGSRFGVMTNELPKPLLPIAGVPILERIITTVKEAGILEFVIVIGYLGEQIKNYFGDGSKWGIRINYVLNTEVDKANGLSVYKAKEHLTENFILLMSDHLFDKEIVYNLRKQEMEDGVMLAVDYKLTSDFIDINDVTKVNVTNNNIGNIGKEIEEYNAFDTGIFLCTPNFFSALEKSFESGDFSISGGMRILATQNQARTFDIKHHFWVDVDTDYFLQMMENRLRIKND